MGADAKRREARKRIFGGLTTKSLLNPGPTADKTEDVADEPLNMHMIQDSENISNKHDQVEDQAIVDAADGNLQDRAMPKPQRFIVFIGNLPYTATDQAVHKHFAKVQPKCIRHRTETEGGKSKGFAFIEFEGYDRMKTCLKLYQGSSFNDGTSPARKLNVELTAGGGGGKSRHRKNKLRAKNERLREQRVRRAQEEEKHGQRTKNKKPDAQGKEDGQAQEGDAVGLMTHSHDSDVHPSRMNRVGVST